MDLGLKEQDIFLYLDTNFYILLIHRYLTSFPFTFLTILSGSLASILTKHCSLNICSKYCSSSYTFLLLQDMFIGKQTYWVKHHDQLLFWLILEDILNVISFCKNLSWWPSQVNPDTRLISNIRSNGANKTKDCRYS